MIYHCENIINFRSPGGYVTKHGGIRTSDRYIFRGAIPTQYSETDLQFLKKLGITRFIDLRTEHEAIENPFAYKDDFQYFNFSINDVGFPADSSKMGDAYVNILRNQRISKVLETIADTSGGVFIGCSLGKDRTGVVMALLLGIAGVNRDDIIADYLLTNPYIYET